MKTVLGSLAVLLLSPVLAADAGLNAAQQEMVDTERAFVRLAAERGFRDAFYAYFSDDGIAAAGDLGWNTGPLVFEGKNGEPDRHGMFFSVWKRQADGTFKVVLDVGSDTPSAVVPMDAPVQSSHRPVATPPGNADVAADIAALLAVERAFLATARTESLGRAYGSRLSDEARVHRPGAMPVVGRVALSAWANAQAAKYRGEPLGADVSRSGDLGYVYGNYERDGDTPEAGYFARVWKRDARGDWRIVMDTISPLPVGVKPLAAELQRAENHYFAGQWAEAEAAYQKHVSAIRNLERSIELSGGIPADFYNLACAHLGSLRDLPRFKALMQPLG